MDPDLHPVQNTEQPIVNVGYKKKGRKGLTYTLFKTQSTPLSASSRKCSWTLTYNLFEPRAAHSQYHVIQNLISTYNMWKVFQYIIDCCHPFCIF